MEDMDYSVSEQDTEGKSAEGSDTEISEAEQETLEDCESDISENKKKRRIFIPVIAVLLAIMIAVSGVFFVIPLFGGNEYEDVAMRFAKAYVQGDVRAISDVSVCDLMSFYEAQLEADSGGDAVKKEQFFVAASDYYGKEIKNLDAYVDAAIEENRKGIVDYYGEYTVEAKILSVKEHEDTTLKSLKDAIDEDKKGENLTVFMDVDADKITSGYIVEVEVTISGAKNKSTNAEKFTIVKYDGEWKAVPGA